MQARLQTAEEIATGPATEIPFLRLPERASVFGDRALRLRMLAPGHPMGGYLELIALVADAQQKLIGDMPPIRLPSADAIGKSSERGVPPLDFQTHLRDPQWRNVLRHLLRQVADRTTGKAAAVLTALDGARDDLYEAQASKLLTGVTSGLDIAAAPFIAAGLQVYFTHLSIALGPESFPRIADATICPCCSSRPAASIARTGDVSGYRFLHCALCNAEWHMVRIKCTNCESTKDISYQAIDDGTPPGKKAVRAEICEQCGTYLKICAMQYDPLVDPIADDLATLSLDLLMEETGKMPSGINFLLVHGDPDFS